MMIFNYKHFLVASLLPLSVMTFSTLSLADNLPYTVTDGNRLDAETYRGYKLFRNWCARCHGSYGQGIGGANLVYSLRTLSKQDFFTTLEQGKVGEIANMPAWQNNIKVMSGKEQLYSYLKARADGAIANIKPQKSN